MQMDDGTTNIDRELLKRRVIGSGSNSQHYVHQQSGRKNLQPDKLTEASFDQIARYSRVLEPWNDDSDSGTPPGKPNMHERGNGRPNLDVRGPDALPLLSDTL